MAAPKQRDTNTAEGKSEDCGGRIPGRRPAGTYENLTRLDPGHKATKSFSVFKLYFKLMFITSATCYCTGLHL